MAWVKIPEAHHPLFYAALPKDKRVSTMQMFGGVAAKANGHMFGGLFGLSAIVRLDDADRAAALALDGAQMFDPMGNGRVSQHSIQLPESVMEDPAELRDWLRKAFEHALTLPPKPAKPARSAKSANKPPARKPAANKPAAKKPPTRKPAARKPAAKKPSAKNLPPAAHPIIKRAPRPVASKGR